MFGVLKIGKLGASMKRFNPRTLFAASEPGAWYDTSDLSTLFQDSAGTVPVTAVEQPVGRILDKSGRGNHATQATATKRPVLKIDAAGCNYLSFDGVDDALSTASIDFTSTDKMTVWAGVTKLSDANPAVITELSNGAVDGVISLQAPFGAGSPSFLYLSRGSTSRWAATLGYPSPSTAVLTGVSDISGDVVSLRVNATVVATTTTDQGAGNYGNYPLYIGARTGTSNFFNGRLYGLIVRGAQSNLSQIEATELYIKQKMRLP